MNASTELTWSSFLRVTSISVSAYDFLITIPAEWRLYHHKGSMRFGWSVSKILFILIRYVSILLLFVSDFGYFYHGFSAAACSRYFMTAPVLKVIQIMISQLIIGYRTWAITRRSKNIGLSLIGLGFIVTAMQWWANVDGRIPVQEDGNCAPGNSRTLVPQWVFYLMAVLYDSTTCIISTFFLVRSAGGVKSMSALVRMLFYDGLGYMMTLTGVNILNLILYRNSVGKSVQASGASFGYLVVWIMSQRILIHIHEAAEERSSGRIFVTHQMSAPRDITQAMRNQLNNSAKDEAETTNDGLDVQVQIEEAVMVDYGRKDGYRKPQVIWKQGATRGERTSGEQNEWELSCTKGVPKATDTV